LLDVVVGAPERLKVAVAPLSHDDLLMQTRSIMRDAVRVLSTALTNISAAANELLAVEQVFNQRNALQEFSRR
jgi:hypothetical protein